MVSYDVVNMYGSVLAEDVAMMALSRLRSDDKLKERAGFSVDSCE